MSRAAAMSTLAFTQSRRTLVEFFSSLKLAIMLMIALAVFSTVGTVIQQGAQPDDYIKEYGETAYWWFTRLGLTDLYHTWWFTSLLLLLCINSLTCFRFRFPAIWRSIHQDRVNVTLEFVRNLKRSTTIKVKATPQQVTEDVALGFAERGYRVLLEKGGAERTIYATKGILGRVAAHVAHLSVTVIVAGGLIGSLFGFRDFGVGVEGQTYYIPQGDFHVRVDKFWLDYYDNGAIKSYNSTLSVLENGEPRVTKTITVNDPLVYKGIWFYQSSYGDVWDRVEKARVVVREKATDKVVGEANLDWQQEANLKHLGLTLQLVDFVADFGFDVKNRRVYSKTFEHVNPAIKLAINENHRALAPQWIFANDPDLLNVRDSRYRFELTGYVPRKYTGLQIAKDPGVLLVWGGATLLVVGVTLSALIYHRRFWAKVLPSADGAIMYVGGTAYKGQMDCDREFQNLVERVKQISRPASDPERESSSEGEQGGVECDGLIVRSQC
jgi:cytochrome c biogenesis protein